MPNWILWEIGKRRLMDAGYHVEKETSRLAARVGFMGFPTFLYLKNGKVSEIRVNQLIKKLNGSK